MDLVREFVAKYDDVHHLVRDDKLKEAKEGFLDLVAVYNKIAESDLEYYHKELAHKQLTVLHSQLTNSERAIRIPINLIVAGVLIVVFSFIIFLHPSIVGLIAFEDQVTQPLNMSFSESKITSLTLKDVPLSLAVTGSLEGDVKLFYKRGNDLVKILDSSELESANFTGACKDTCKMKADSNVVELFAQVSDGSFLHITELVYTVPRNDNQAPVWVGEDKVFRVKDELVLDLDENFNDPDGDDLVYLSTSADGLKVVVEDNLVRVAVLPGFSGDERVTLIASDLDELSKVPVRVVSAE